MIGLCNSREIDAEKWRLIVISPGPPKGIMGGGVSESRCRKAKKGQQQAQLPIAPRRLLVAPRRLLVAPTRLLVAPTRLLVPCTWPCRTRKIAFWEILSILRPFLPSDGTRVLRVSLPSLPPSSHPPLTPTRIKKNLPSPPCSRRANPGVGSWV